MNYPGLVIALIARRMDLGWSQAELARRLNTTQDQVSKLENMKVSARRDTLHKWGDALEVHINYSIRAKAPRRKDG